MNAKHLLQHFDRFSEAPGAIPRLRRFILDLAVRGKLVDQDPRDEPASELLKRIHTEKSQPNKKQRHLAQTDGSIAPFGVPPKWELVPLIALGTWAIGSGFPNNEQGIPDGPYFFLKVSDMNLPGNEKYIVSSRNFIDDAAAMRMRARIHPPGTIIFPKIGGAIATNKRRILTRGSAIDNNCLGMTFWPSLSVDWCYLLLTTLDFTQYQAGTAVPALQQRALEQIPVGLPPLAEQHRIVAKVDELMALCDQLEAAKLEREQSRDRLVAASLHRLNLPADKAKANTPDAFRDHARFTLQHFPHLTTRAEHIKQLRQTILDLAVRGKLVPQDPNDEPAREMLERIEKHKTTVGVDKTGRDWIRDETGLAPEAFLPPPGWVWTRIAHAVERVTVGFVGSMKQHYVAEGVPFLRSQNVRANRFRSDGMIYISPAFHSRIMKSALSPGDVVVVRSGNVGTACAIPAFLPEANCSDLVVVKKPLALVAEFLCFYLNSLASVHVEENTVGVALTHFNTKSVATMPILVPPLAEQRRIVARVDEVMTLCDQLEIQLNSTATDNHRLLEAMLHEALAPALEESA